MSSFFFFVNECIQSFHIAGIGVESLSRDSHFLADALPPVGIDEETVWCAGAAVSAGCFFANDMCRFLTLFKQTQWPKTPKRSLSIEYQRCLLVPGEESLGQITKMPIYTYAILTTLNIICVGCSLFHELQCFCFISASGPLHASHELSGLPV